MNRNVAQTLWNVSILFPAKVIQTLEFVGLENLNRYRYEDYLHEHKILLIKIIQAFMVKFLSTAHPCT